MFSHDTNITNTLVHQLQLIKPCGAKKTTQKTVKERMQKKRQNLSNRTVCKDEFFRGTSVAQIKKL